jgi:hypothetical protein
MSLFGTARPKGITKEELRFVEGELKNTPFGEGAKELTDRQAEEIIHRLELCLDADSALDHRNNWSQAGQDEVNAITAQAASDRNLHLTPTQQEHVKKILQKYIDINKHGGMFSI